MSCRDAFIKELDARKTLNIKTNAIRDEFQNRPIDRYHNELRAVAKSKRELGNDKSAQDFIDGYRIWLIVSHVVIKFITDNHAY